jgi:DNA primase
LRRIPSDVIDQIRDRVDMVDLVGRFVGLKRSGRSYKGLCPFHHEKTPSFNVNPDRQAYHCFGCGEGGDAFGFLMKVENLSFAEAVRKLGGENGIEVPEGGGGDEGLSEKLRAANELAEACYRAALAVPGNPAAAYLESRGLDAATIERFGIGFAPDSWDFLTSRLREEKIEPQMGEQAGLLAERQSGGHYDRFRGRVVFPIRDVRGRVVAFGGRAISDEQQPKYLNSPETPIFRKREAFYGFPMALEAIRRSERAVVVEGYFDLIALHRAGVEGTLATCGTALTPDHGRALLRRTRQVVLLFDGDEAGQRAAERSLEILLPLGLRVRTALLPAGDDPDSLLTREGPEALNALVDRAPPALEAAISRAAASGSRTPWEKADVVASVAKLVALVESPVERGAYCTQLALAVGAEPSHVEAAVRAVKRGGDAAAEIPVEVRKSGPEERILQQLMRTLLVYPSLTRHISRDEFEAMVPAGPASRVVLALIDAASRDRFDLEALAEDLEELERQLLWSLAAEGYEQEPDAAERTVDDTLVYLRKRHARNTDADLTRRMRDPEADGLGLLREKQALRAAACDDSRTPPAGSQP